MHQLSAAFTAGSLNNKTGQEAHFVDEDKRRHEAIQTNRVKKLYLSTLSSNKVKMHERKTQLSICQQDSGSLIFVS